MIHKWIVGASWVKRNFVPTLINIRIISPQLCPHHFGIKRPSPLRYFLVVNVNSATKKKSKGTQ